MSFVSLQFILFLPLVFLLYWFVFRRQKWQNLLVAVASYVFYGWWDWRFLCLIFFTTVCSYASGMWIERFDGKRGIQKSISTLNILVNLAILGVFKYYNFFVDSMNDLVAVFGYQLDWPTANLILPVGISFYTFQALSYSIDIYKGKLKPTHDFVAFVAFISFFPQLVAGPIERASHLLPQFLSKRRFDYERAVDGCRQMLWGFFKKMVVADMCATVVNHTWTDFSSMSTINLWTTIVLFSFQIYCDFSAYSDIAIGCARLFGFDLVKNFNYPYFSRNIPEFWRRWHMSLLSWFRDYVYFPLGGSRCAKWRIVMNTITVFVISGLWHGAAWTFVVYGIFHGLMCSFYAITGLKSKYEHGPGHGRILPSLKELGMMVLTFALVSVARVLFRAEGNLTLAFDYYQQMFSFATFYDGDIVGIKAMAVCALLVAVEWVKREHNHPLELANHGLMQYRAMRWTLYVALASITFFCQAGEQDFIYFQF